MELAQMIEIIGWIFVIIPVLIYLVGSIYAIRGVMTDDTLIKSFVLIVLGCFLIGVVVLLLLYLTNIFQENFSSPPVFMVPLEPTT